MKSLLCLLAQLLLLTSLYGQPINLKKDTQFEYDIHISWPKDKNDCKYTYQFKVLDKEGNNTVLECRLVKAWMLGQYAEGMFNVFNTDTIRKNKFNSTQAFLQIAILNKPLKLVIDPNSKIVRLTGVTEAINDAAVKWGLRPYITNMLLEMANNYPLFDIKDSFFTLPDQKLAYGYEWKEKGGLYNKVTAVTGALFHITSADIPNSFTVVPPNNSFIALNTITGLCEQVNKQIALKDGVSNDKNPIILYRYEQKLRNGAGVYPIDTAWINMAIKTNMNFSIAFMSKSNTVDSAKVNAYYKTHNAVFGKDPTYMVNKLGLVQQSSDRDNYNQYGSLLLQTPTRYLANESSHLYNKMGESIKTSVDSAYEVTKYLIKHDGFKGWVQENFAQQFNRWNEKDLTEDPDFKNYVKAKGITPDSVQRMLNGFATARKNSLQLLTRLHADKDPKMRQYVDALHLWVDAKQHDQDGAYLVKSGDKLLQMNDTYMQKGNGSRYALLIYKLQLKAKKQKEADALLQKTINRLEGSVADTLNKDRYADQNILAYAWYLKYAAAKPADSVKALKYLSKAAQYAPKNNREKAYTSFYDRVFLESKESYRDEFISSLFKNGNNEEALKVFVQHINAEPGSLDEMRKLYETNFPGKDFKIFFANDIVSAWPEAPQFALKGIDGKEKSLANFKSTWLVIDFWGTWCPPCRNEMPDLNKFNKELNDGKHNGITFLSVACRDRAENVEAYFKENQFNMPVVMSDALIEKQYHVPYYPSKVIVSPEGKMLLLKSGDNWQQIVKSFNQLAAGDMSPKH
jgi:thiol-disulfide isomerase/thioredoxin